MLSIKVLRYFCKFMYFPIGGLQTRDVWKTVSQWINYDVDFGFLPEINAKVDDGCTREQMMDVTDNAFTFYPVFITDYDYHYTTGVTAKVDFYINCSL